MDIESQTPARLTPPTSTDATPRQHRRPADTNHVDHVDHVDHDVLDGEESSALADQFLVGGVAVRPLEGDVAVPARAGGPDAWAVTLGRMDETELRRMALSLPAIEQAKGILMGCYGVDPDAAFSLLRRCSQQHHVKIRDLAAAVVTAASSQQHPASEPSGSSLEQVRRLLTEGPHTASTVSSASSAGTEQGHRA